MKALFIGGTGTISTAIVKRLVNDLGAQVWLLNRGNRKDVVPEGVHQIVCDIYNEADAAAKLEGMEFDVVSDFIAFDVSAVERDLIGLCVLAVYLVSENSHVIIEYDDRTPTSPMSEEQAQMEMRFSDAFNTQYNRLVRHWGEGFPDYYGGCIHRE
ncbi:MAG: hypothetical protein K5655_09120 [Lachnospiraceae bacterium]|nr:hypothetical protein [Lachnospiraceae bacterium]